MPLYNPDKFLLIAGPCMLESEEVCRSVAIELDRIRSAYPELLILFKAGPGWKKAWRCWLPSRRSLVFRS
jgi:3-deoxy-D-manno-octulosonic acid (KDO) 8-phosphate synthase